MSYCLNPDCQKPQNRNSAELCHYCGARLLLKDRYRPAKPIGQGGFGRTFLAIDEDKPSKPRCVIKQFLPVNQDAQHLKKAAQLFEREAMRLEELGNHPQIPTLLAYFRQERQQYLVQEFVNGKNLAELLHDEGAFTEAQVRSVLVGLLPVLEFIHAHSVIHRDLKPSNVIQMSGGGAGRSSEQASNQLDWAALQHALALEAAQGCHDFVSDRRFSDRLSASFAQPPKALSIAVYKRWQQLATQFASYTELSLAQRQALIANTSRLLYELRRQCEPHGEAIEGRLALVDFGAAKAATGTTWNKTGTTIGSPEYLAPEQSRGKAVFASDLFSLGVTCIHLLTQRSPFDLFDSSDHTWIWRKYLTVPVSEALGHVLDRLLEPGVNQRYQSATEVLRDLDGALLEEHLSPVAAPLLAVSLAAPIAGLAPPAPIPMTFRSTASAAVQAIAHALAPSLPQQKLQPLPQPLPQQQPQPLPQQNAPQNIQRHSSANGAKNSSHRQPKAASWQCVHQWLNPGKVYAIALSPTEPILASSSGTTIKLWDVQTGQPLRTLTGHLDVVSCLVVSPDGKLLISGSADKSIRLWDLQTGQRINTIALHTDTILSLALSSDGRMLASGSLYDPIKLWDLETNQELVSLSGQAGRIEALAFSPDGLWLASGSNDATIALWELNLEQPATGRTLRMLKGHSQTVAALTFEPDGKTLASGSWDGTVKLWSTRTQREKRTLQPESGRVTALTVSPDGKLLCTGSDTLKLWQPRTGKALATLTGHTSVVSAIALSTNNRTIASSSWDGTIRLWQQ
ncbi:MULTISPECIES: serine/threonine-protein kinase [Cyanophyceae]|nr:serine/threonine-protein kinase [Phormidium sp. FACHB-592]